MMYWNSKAISTFLEYVGTFGESENQEKKLKRYLWNYAKVGFLGLNSRTNEMFVKGSKVR